MTKIIGGFMVFFGVSAFVPFFLWAGFGWAYPGDGRVFSELCMAIFLVPTGVGIWEIE